MRDRLRAWVLPLLLAVLILPAGGCDWLDKAMQCAELGNVSTRWSERADAFDREIQAELAQNLASLDAFDASSRAGFVKASVDLHEASDTVDRRVGPFVESFSNDFRAVKLSDPGLLDLRERYVAQATDMGAKLRDLSNAVRHLGDLFAHIDPERITSPYQATRLEAKLQNAETRIQSAEQRVEASVAAEEKLIAEINRYCWGVGG